MQDRLPVVVVGGGLAGLSCAGELARHRESVLVVEGADRVGGRVQSDEISGFVCDRGFQVFLTSYPEPRRCLDYESLNLGVVTPGAVVFDGEKLWKFCDPWRRPERAWDTFRAPVGSLRDKLKLSRLREDAIRFCRQRPEASPQRSTLEELQARGFSETMIERFFRPFLGGIFLDHSLNASAEMLLFVFGMFATGDATLPAGGMKAIPEQLADRLSSEQIRLSSSVASIDAGGVAFASGERINARKVVLATDGPAAAGLLGQQVDVEEGPATTTLYFTGAHDPIGEPILVLNGSGTGRVNSVLNVAAVSPNYSPAGDPLFSVSLLGEYLENDEELAEKVLVELADWFGESVLDWTLVSRTTVRNALPDQSRSASRYRGVKSIDGVTICGDWRSYGSIHHAMQSGREAALSVLRSSGS